MAFAIAAFPSQNGSWMSAKLVVLVAVQYRSVSLVAPFLEDVARRGGAVFGYRDGGMLDCGIEFGLHPAMTMQTRSSPGSAAMLFAQVEHALRTTTLHKQDLNGRT